SGCAGATSRSFTTCRAQGIARPAPRASVAASPREGPLPARGPGARVAAGSDEEEGCCDDLELLVVPPAAAGPRHRPRLSGRHTAAAAPPEARGRNPRRLAGPLHSSTASPAAHDLDRSPRGRARARGDAGGIGVAQA